ncbi:hypothetical protein Pfl01_1749 [Pseudomonas fluorescens Pf0-1]|uniref:Uncharacterized protein n=2 Tax=Pseudomonas TaxID=286 RepID=Q3KFG4_PSEPF|nr:hypothetical protein Pfl01_1749 [Pseudomonas fluorescens Pf0-1]
MSDRLYGNPALCRVFCACASCAGTNGDHTFRTFTHLRLMRCAMTPETEGKEEKGPSGLPFINDPGNEDPGSLMDDATVPLLDGEEELEYEDFDDDE